MTHADEDMATCDICANPLKDGDLCLTDIDLGPVHADCCGPERECYVNLDTGEPIPEGEPLPTPYVWSNQ